MAYDREAKKLLPHSAEEIQELEKRLLIIINDLRELRTRMADSKMPTVELKLGTFEHCVERMEPFPKKFLGEFDAQKVVKETREAREKIRQDMKAKPAKKS